LRVTLDTSFLILHYFSKEADVLRKSRSVLHFCRLAGNGGILPTVVLAEFYAIARRDAGRDVAELRLKELADSGLEVVQLSQDAARESGILRAKYHEKIPWGDCFIAGTHIVEKADLVLSEDPHFRDIREIKTRKLGEFKP
jgi:predicted nucleic acid-binding protein